MSTELDRQMSALLRSRVYGRASSPTENEPVTSEAAKESGPVKTLQAPQIASEVKPDPKAEFISAIRKSAQKGAGKIQW